MSRSATTPNNAKRSRRNGSSAAGGSAAPDKTAGNTNEVVTVSPLKAALVSQKVGLESLPVASTPFLTPIAEKCLKDFATFFYTEDKAKGTKSDPNHVASSARKLNIVLTAEASVQESQAFTALRDELTADLEKFRLHVTRTYVLVAADMTVDAMRTRYHASICKWIRGIATVFIAQQGIENYNGDAAIMDIIAIDQDTLLVPLGLTIPQFLSVYKTSNKLPLLPTPTVNCTFQNVIDQINGASINPPPLPNEDENVIVVYNQNQNQQDQDEEMVNALDEVEQQVAIGGRTIVYQLIKKVYIDSIVTPLEEFHAQLKRNAEVKRIKNAFTSAGLTDTAERVAEIIGREPPAQQPVLRGLIDETTSKKTAAMERRIQSLEDKLKASNIKAKKVNGDGTKPKSNLRKGTPIAEKSNAHENSSNKKRTPKKSSKSGSPNHDANNKGSARGKGKKNGKGRKVSFDGKKAASRTNSPK